MGDSAELRGVGGWLLFFITAITIIGPIICIGTTAAAFSQIESSMRGLQGDIYWESHKRQTWFLIIGSIILFEYCGFRLWRKHNITSVKITISIMWFITFAAPLLSAAIIAAHFPETTLSRELKAASDLFLSYVIASTVWTIYFKRSRRIRNTYPALINVSTTRKFVESPTDLQATIPEDTPSSLSLTSENRTSSSREMPPDNLVTQQSKSYATRISSGESEAERSGTRQGMNDTQRRIFLIALTLFAISILYVPEGVMKGTVAIFYGWNFIWELERDIVLKILFLEWTAIGVIGGGLIFYCKAK